MPEENESDGGPANGAEAVARILATTSIAGNGKSAESEVLNAYNPPLTMKAECGLSGPSEHQLCVVRSFGTDASVI